MRKSAHGYCDFHTHSTFSDGTYTPTALIAAAKESGLSAVALTDHNNMGGLAEFTAAGALAGIEAIPGIELSTDHALGELHIVGLFVYPTHYGAIKEALAELSRLKTESNIALCKALTAAGYPVSYEKIIAKTPNGHINRVHIAAALCEGGYVGSVDEAFSGILSKEHGFYKPPRRPDAIKTIRLLHKIGVVSVLAHPLLSLGEASLRTVLADAVPAGLDAMETRYSTYTEEESATAARLAREFSLLESGGSDFHGDRKPDIALGRGRGDLSVPISFLAVLKERAQAFKNS